MSFVIGSQIPTVLINLTSVGNGTIDTCLSFLSYRFGLQNFCQVRMTFLFYPKRR